MLAGVYTPDYTNREVFFFAIASAVGVFNTGLLGKEVRRMYSRTVSLQPVCAVGLVLGLAVAALWNPCVPILHGRVRTSSILPTGVGFAALLHPLFLWGLALMFVLIQLWLSSTRCTTGWLCCVVSAPPSSQQGEANGGPGWALAGLEVWGAAAMPAPRGQVAWWSCHSVCSETRWIRRRLIDPALYQHGV